MANGNNSFWTTKGLQDPKRAFRFLMTIAASGHQWIVKKVSKPKFSITEAKHAYINHTFYYPGRVEWEEISFTLVDPVSPDAMADMLAIVNAAGYHPPVSVLDTSTMSKARATTALGNVNIAQIDENGKSVESWDLWNCWVKKVEPSELSYEEDGLSEIVISVRYDWAVYNAGIMSPGATISTYPNFNKKSYFNLGDEPPALV